MVETFLIGYHRDLSLCNACDKACHVELDIPPPGPQNTILRTGRLLLSAENERIGQAIARTDECLAEIGAKAKELMDLVAQLHEGERELKALRSVQQAYLAPVRKLPPEILSIIFKMYCGDESINLFVDRCPPLILSSVCNVWRETVLGLHSVWNHFEFSRYGESNLENLLIRLRAFLEYSGDLPLRHCVLAYDLDTVSTPDLKRMQALDLLIEHAHRWTEVEFESGGGGLSEGARRVLAKLDGRRLTHLQKVDGDVHVLAACSAMGLFEGLTALRRVSLRGGPHDLGRTDMLSDLPWDHVEELETFLPCDYALAYLQRCPNLVKWEYADTSQFGPGQMYLPRSHIILPRLHTATFSLSRESDIGLLSGITTPVLQDCAVYFFYGFLTRANIGFDNLLTRSACPLRRLVLENPSSPVMRALYSDSLQELTFLSVHAYRTVPITDKFIDLLSTPDSAGRPRLLPLLESLELGGRPDCFNATALVRLAEARREMGYPLKRFVLDMRIAGMSSTSFGWNDNIERCMAKVVDSVEVRGRFRIRPLSPSP
ncbi:uncharacterized protein SCHCODRAFT_02556642 [Schizophyllum commune H4-8]|nr:uncharacterized protein SCHCODRAFT_02556642 [Schizophyllum commune H4-8]KAI5886102.1 hypothetical protein SCHCODRAFT_02556642 [Schizophyllum commune H4-8]